MRKRPQVALLIESSRAYGRGLLRGVASYLRTHRPWSIYVEPHGLEQPPPEWIRTWKGDGILARVTDARVLELLLASKLPTIDLRGAVADSGIPLVGLDSHGRSLAPLRTIRSPVGQRVDVPIVDAEVLRLDDRGGLALSINVGPHPREREANLAQVGWSIERVWLDIDAAVVQVR